MPTVVFGFFALTFVTPTILQDLLSVKVQIFNALAAGLVMGIMIVPTIASISEDSMRAVPQGLREGAYGLGATKRQVATRVVFPAAISGIVASIVLGISRGVGETMIVLVAAGLQPNCGVNPTEGYATITTFMGATAKGDNPAGHDRVQDDLRLRPDPVRAHPGHEHDRDPLRPQVPRGLRVMAAPPPDGGRRGAVRGRSSRPAAARRRLESSASRRCLLACLAIAIVTLVVLLVDVLVDGVGSLSLELPHRRRPRGSIPENSGIGPALVGHALADGSSAPRSSSRSGSPPRSTSRSTPTASAGSTASSRSTSRTSPRCPRSSTGSSASPSWSAARSASATSLIAGGLTLGLLVLPVVIVAGREAIRAVPPSIREGSMALGATKWQTIWKQVLPAALPGIATGTILSLSRAIGETAPLIVVGAAAFATSSPSGLFDDVTALPIQIFSWISDPRQEYKALAAAGIIVLMAILLAMNAVAIWLRNRYETEVVGE